MILYSYPISPYAQKVAAILRHKGLAFEERFVHPLRRGELRRLSGQRKVPVLVDGEKVIGDSTRIAKYLDEAYPDRPVYPQDPAQRSLALLLEEWADEGLPRVVIPALYFIPANARNLFERFRAGYPAGRAQDAAFATVRRVVMAAHVRRYGEPYGWKPRAAAILNRLAEACDYADGVIGPQGWLVGDQPTAADFAVWGFLHLIEGLDGWETVRGRRKLALLVKAIGKEADRVPAGPAEGADAQARLDASALRAGTHKRATA